MNLFRIASFICVLVFFPTAGSQSYAEERGNSSLVGPGVGPDKESELQQKWGYSRSLSGADTNLLLVQMSADRGNIAEIRSVTVLADMRGKIKAGTKITVQGIRNHPEKQLPGGGDEAIGLWPVRQDAAGKYEYFDTQAFAFPIGLNPYDRIAAADADKVKAAMKELAAAIADPEHAGPSRARAGELLEDKNYYLWALGVWRIAHDSNVKDIEMLKSLFNKEDLTPAQAVWLDLVLYTQVTAEDTTIRPSEAELHGLLRGFLQRYAKRHASPPGGVEPTTVPAGKGDGVPGW